MSGPRRKFTQEFKDESGREVIGTSQPIRDVAEAYGGAKEYLPLTERARLKESKRENQDLRQSRRF